MANNGINIGLKSYDDLFKTDEGRKTEEIKPIPLSELKGILYFEKNSFPPIFFNSVQFISWYIFPLFSCNILTLALSILSGILPFSS